MNSTDFDYNTPLHLAAEKGNISCVSVLLECQGISTVARNANSRTALHLAAKNGHPK